MNKFRVYREKVTRLRVSGQCNARDQGLTRTIVVVTGSSRVSTPVYLYESGFQLNGWTERTNDACRVSTRIPPTVCLADLWGAFELLMLPETPCAGDLALLICATGSGARDFPLSTAGAGGPGAVNPGISCSSRSSSSSSDGKLAYIRSTRH